MDIWILIFCVIPTLVTTITISPNGNSPHTKMVGGMTIDAHRTVSSDSVQPEIFSYNRIEKNKILKDNSTKLAINERYRRLIPYMTFYYANDLVTSTTEAQNTNVEVQKAEIIEAGTITPIDRKPRVIYTVPRHKNIPRYLGNRLTQFNIASANPTKIYYKDIPAVYHNAPKSNPTYHALLPEHIEQSFSDSRDIVYDRYVPAQIKTPSTPFASSRQPYLNVHENTQTSNVQYYSPDQIEVPKYKLIPYEQTPPVKVENIISTKKTYAPLLPKDPLYVKPIPSQRPQQLTIYENLYTQPIKTRKPTTISEIYYERRPVPVPVLMQPVMENGFKPIMNSHVLTTEAPLYSSTVKEDSYAGFINEKKTDIPVVEEVKYSPTENNKEDAIEQHVYEIAENEPSDSISLANLLNSLQINKSIPRPITKANIGASIRTLIQVLNTLNAQSQQNEVETIGLSTPKPFEPQEVVEVEVETTPSHIFTTTPKPLDFNEETYLAPIKTPSQHLDEYQSGGGSTQRFPLPVTSDNEGGTPGRPDIDYPILTVIPPTSFDCKTQRYKGFFADTETRCQVWHYCDLNGGQASFLCPNGTIFSQAALTCDWWFNVRCASTTQLYVLNESLYKYILPHSPKFPEDYSGPLVDKYLSLKFKEMEEQFKKNKNKKVASDKMDDSNSDSTDVDSSETKTDSEKPKEASINQADVIIETPGRSGNVQRLEDV